ncbi:flagellar filament capping protein FliD [Selenomonas ruminantium]|uniref:Flagellar hook-associated protein 2 n=1 Tax=Selenomonas ruminantium TaxID=971 RepID=A0A1H3ZGZ2_SELRU|nr:flagellar filament capping protein FliD [Selenomonas ruminantium]SEA22915.1 flagellar hook-associated protein 2 [Selenomonas ruminantium]
MSGMGIYGLSGSGIDVDSMVRMGMMTKQNQYDKMYKEEVKNEWVKEAYTNMYSSLNTFNSSTLYDYKLSSTTSPMNASSSNSTVATAVANADAASMSHTVNVTKTASNAYLLTADKIKRNNTNLSESIYLKDILFTKEEQDTLASEISGDSEEAKKKADTALISFDIADGIESDSKKKTISFTYAEILRSNLTVNDLASRVNQSGVNIKASYDSANDAFSLYQKEGGASNQILLSVKSSGDGYDNGKTLLNNLRMASVTQDLDAENQLTSKLSKVMTVETTTGTSSIGGAQNSYTSTVTVGNDTTLSSLFTGTKVGTDTPMSFTISTGSDSGKLTLNYGGGVTVQKFIEDINASGNYSAELDSDGHLQIAAKDADKNVSFEVNNTDSSVAAENGRYLLNALKFSGISTELTADVTGLALQNDDGTYTQGASGVSAEVTIDGRTYKSDTSKISVGNVTYTLASKGATTVSVTQNTDKLIENVKKFVEDYNKMLDELNTKYYEEKYSDYGVLTQTQEKGMTKEQIDKWNEKAKSGLLNHDQNIGKIISEMREAIYTPVEGVTGKYNTMMSIGISSSTDRGHLTLDEEKLKKALAAEPDCVRELFNSSGDYTDKNGKVQTDYDKQGVIGRISDSLYKNLKTMKSYAGTTTEAADGSSLGDLIRELQTKMSNFKTMMKSYENLLYKKYDAMEIAIQRMSVSMGYITGGQ